jgi:serine protease Do
VPLPMPRRVFLGLVLILITRANPTAAQPARAGESLRKTPIVKAVARVQPSVVNISSEKKAGSSSRWPFSSEESQRPRVNGMGSGVIIDGRGYILTNQHVVDKVQTIEAHLSDGSSHLARVIQQDREMDLALIKIEAGRPLPSVPIGTSSDLMIGETVITIGNAFGYENTVSVGIISALKRNVTLSDEQVYRNLVQTDACINPGNSGGPLVNIEGELIGINVATRSGAQGIGFALPIDDVKRVAVEMLSTRRVSGTWHGLVAAEVWQGDDRKVVIREVPSGSPASEAGFLPGDHIVKVGDFEVTNTIDIERGLLDAQAGRPTRVSILRGGKASDISLDLKPSSRAVAAARATDPTEYVEQVLGVKVVPVAAEYVASVSAQLHGGLYISEVTPGSPAAKANVQKGDILVGVNVGDRHWETLRPDTVVYTLRQPQVSRTQTLPFYIVRRNNIHQGEMNLVESASNDHTSVRR